MRFRVTVCELDSEPDRLEADWRRLTEHVRQAGSDLVVLPEMPFYTWFAWTRTEEAGVWRAAVDAHTRWLARLPELGARWAAGSRPVDLAGARRNEGFLWEAGGRYQAAHHKYYLPDENGYWEASWYERGDGRFELVQAGPASLGWCICTELWFLERARAYGRAGAQLIVTPRATEKATVDKWLVAGRAAAVSAGAFSLSSNHINPPGRPADLGGQGWIIGPDGEVLALTTRAQPFVTLDLDLAEADRAKATYPRYVKE